MIIVWWNIIIYSLIISLLSIWFRSVNRSVKYGNATRNWHCVSEWVRYFEYAWSNTQITHQQTYIVKYKYVLCIIFYYNMLLYPCPCACIIILRSSINQSPNWINITIGVFIYWLTYQTNKHTHIRHIRVHIIIYYHEAHFNHSITWILTDQSHKKKE